ncbi:unnamed protein product [Prorocentrum cordatum]|uniref:RRM domain-containing protein n=1 Tax=Prorocentrum cordatum TaxID=2364126 RepID=A0ABN9VRI0_9DINO|nr:unnamed protein product [Polarella glacialis]
MARTNAELRLAPLDSTFQVWGEPPRARNRSHSHPGYAPHHLRPTPDDLEDGRGIGRRCALPGVAACTCAASDGGSTSAPGSSASEAPGSPRGHEEQASGLDEESAQELWPDTDEDDEAFEWTPCSSRRGAAVPAPVGAGAWAEGVACFAFLAPPRVFATAQASMAACSPAVTSALRAPPSFPLAPVHLRGHAEAAPPGGLPVLARPALVLQPVAAVAFGGQQCSPPIHTVPPGAAATTPCGADSLESAMRSAESALAAIESEEAAPAAEGPGCAATSQQGSAAAAARAAGTAVGAAGAAAAAPQQTPQAGAGKAARRIGPGVTSLMMRGLPREVSQHEVLGEVHRSGFAGRVDFFYMPRDFDSRKTKGHAFLNFVSSEVATEFQRAWHGRPTCAGRPVGARGLDVSVATQQGLAVNISRWEGSRLRRVRDPDFQPFVLGRRAAHTAGRP